MVEPGILQKMEQDKIDSARSAGLIDTGNPHFVNYKLALKRRNALARLLHDELRENGLGDVLKDYRIIRQTT